jgi:hypothetical protein
MTHPPRANDFPRLDDRARGWLRFIWDKATTPDDWSSAGEPLHWWDTRSTPPLCSLGRFDLHETGYVLPVMCDLTPAWREGYTRIADELVGRYTTFWSVIDWVTMIGHDPNAASYPPMWQAYSAEFLRGSYDSPGWVANGVSPWGLQPDPVGADGNNFFRAFFNLLLSFYGYVCDDGKWEAPFKVTGYQDRLLDWDHHAIVEFMVDQWAERPAGVHCENTKIWPFCVSGAGLGLQLYDKLHRKDTHRVFGDWADYCRKHYMKTNRRGELEWFTFYYDPLERTNYVLRDEVSAYASLCVTPYVHPQDQALAELLYTSSVRTLGWDDPKKPLLQLHPDPRWLAIGLLMAREVGDHQTETRLREVAERDFEPRWFGEDEDRFGWFFGNGEPWPRGQLASLMVLSELGEPGSWSRVFTEPNLHKFAEPTLTGVDYPRLGVAQAWNDLCTGVLWVETCVATTAAAGTPTSFRVTQLPSTAEVRISCDGNEFTGWRACGADSIEICSDVGNHVFRIESGFRSPATAVPGAATVDAATEQTAYPAAGCTSSCC